MSARTLALLGDSILDNRSYTAPEPDTATHLSRLLGSEWRTLLLAQDGARIADVPRQLMGFTGNADLAVLSVGGNDVTGHIDLLARRGAAGEILGQLLAIADAFEQAYERMAEAVSRRAGRIVLCTIYEVPLEPPALARLARVPLAVLNDRITRIAARRELEVLDLRSVCTDLDDFVLQVEPSARGAGKIARAIATVAGAGPRLRGAKVYAG
jgi:hypothetical protein